MIDKLKALALAAKSEDADQSWYSSDDLLTGSIDRTADAAFITAASPDVVLALIKRAEDAEARIAEMEGQNQGPQNTIQWLTRPKYPDPDDGVMKL